MLIIESASIATDIAQVQFRDSPTSLKNLVVNSFYGIEVRQDLTATSGNLNLSWASGLFLLSGRSITAFGGDIISVSNSGTAVFTGAAVLQSTDRNVNWSVPSIITRSYSTTVSIKAHKSFICTNTWNLIGSGMLAVLDLLAGTPNLSNGCVLPKYKESNYIYSNYAVTFLTAD
jgi:hypothetical protein